MDINELLTAFSSQTLLNLFFKAFAILFSFMYLIYAIVITKQTQVMNETLKAAGAPTISLVSLLQVFIGIGLLLLAIFLV